MGVDYFGWQHRKQTKDKAKSEATDNENGVKPSELVTLDYENRHASTTVIRRITEAIRKKWEEP